MLDKHSGAMIGFTKLGDINDNLLKFERSVTEDQPSSCQEYDGFYGARPVQQTFPFRVLIYLETCCNSMNLFGRL